MLAFKEKVRAPELRGEVWLNTPEPLSMVALRGQVVLIDFWDYTCINCLHTLPYLREWHRRYHQKGLVIVGVHAPEFAFAKDSQMVEEAVLALALPYPVTLDNAYQTWNAYANRAWPAKYLVDQDGYIRAFHYGEGAYQEFEEAIQQLLKERDPALTFPAPMAPVRELDVPGNLRYRATPELYLGTRRGALGNQEKPVPDQVTQYSMPEYLSQDTVYLSGFWLNGDEFIESVNAQPASMVVKYAAGQVNLVMGPVESKPVTVRLRQDGQDVPQASWGQDVRLDAVGKPIIQVDRPRMYQLIENPAFGYHTLELLIEEPALRAYAFTFVSCVSEDSAIA